MSACHCSDARKRAVLIALCLTVSAPSVSAQSIKIGPKEVAVHGSFQQGFAITDHNNFLTMDTTSGSAAMTDGSVNVSSSLTRKLRVGAQLYARNIGDLGNGHATLDWAFADYKFNTMVGVRGGKIKTVLGLFTDTQDTEFLYTWALLPQSIYPLDQRSITISHIGADIYGAFKLGKAGSLAYTAYLGKISDDPRGGYKYGAEDIGLTWKGDFEKGGGFDTRWTTPVPGLMAGYSFTQMKGHTDLMGLPTGGPGGAPGEVAGPAEVTRVVNDPWRHQAVFADYQGSRLLLNGELRLDKRVVSGLGQPPTANNSQSWFATASYQLFEKLAVGTYHSRYVYNTALDAALSSNHIYDTAITGRVDINRFWNVKIEGHFMDGYGDTTFSRGFYLRNNASLTPKTTMLVLRTGISF